MSIITTPITSQSFEIVRDRIGRIIADEMNNQFQITYDGDLLVTNWIERFLQFDKGELPAINVMLAEGNSVQQTQTESQVVYRYYIDVYVNAKSASSDPGDQRAIRILHKILGRCRAILEHTRYKTLGFTAPPGFIMNRHFESIQIQNPNEKQHDALSSVMGRLIFSVKVPEYNGVVEGIASRQFDTSIKLADTEKGYQWVNRSSFIYDTFDYSFD